MDVGSLHFGWYDGLLTVLVTTMGAATAYVRNPFWKAFILLLPIPSTLALLAVGAPLDASCPAGIVLLLLYFSSVDQCYRRLRLPIMAAIAAGVVLYCGPAWLLKPWLTADSGRFWPVWGTVLALAAVLYHFTPELRETGQRTTLPGYWKIPLLLAVCVTVVVMKHWLAGLIVMFPMVGVVGAYEARSCLRTVYRQTLLYALIFLPLAAAVFLTQARLGLPGALAVGWGVYLLGLWLSWRHWIPAGKSHEDAVRGRISGI